MPRLELKAGKNHVEEKERRLRANDRAFNLQFDYAKNSIKTSKYNICTFLPLNLFEQFQRIANAYFLFLLILQLIPAISSLSWFTTVVPLVLVLTVSAAKDAIDDVNRHQTDNQVNNRPVKVLVDGSLKEDRWLNVEVGDIIKLENNNFVTADLLLLSSSEPHSLTYIETVELDGETNLKVKQALTVTSEMGEDLQALSSFDDLCTLCLSSSLLRFTLRASGPPHRWWATLCSGADPGGQARAKSPAKPPTTSWTSSGGTWPSGGTCTPWTTRRCCSGAAPSATPTGASAWSSSPGQTPN